MDAQPVRVADALNLEALARQLSETSQRARQVARGSYLTESELVQVLHLAEQADTMAVCVRAMLDVQQVQDAVRQAQRDGVLDSDRLRREFVV